MSYHGAPWLERPGRAEEEAPELLLAALGLDGGETVVDLGCGSGYYTRRLAQAVGESGAVYGVDIQPEMLELLRRSAEEAGLDNVVPVLGATDDMRLPPQVVGEVDLILLVDVYHEIQDPAAMLANMRQALAPGGRVALVEFRLEGETAAHIKPDHRMSIEQVRREWEPAGFELVELVEELPTQHLFLFRRGSS
jgi:ubiquinone/menaquinone biosynthesis C-methylase UbiE